MSSLDNREDKVENVAYDFVMRLIAAKEGVLFDEIQVRSKVWRENDGGPGCGAREEASFVNCWSFTYIGQSYEWNGETYEFGGLFRKNEHYYDVWPEAW